MTTKGSEFSIFQNAPSIQMENNQQRVEEEEALQDQKRRQEEVNALEINIGMARSKWTLNKLNLISPRLILAIV